MKTNIINTIGILALAIAAGSANAQTVPNSFNYQAVITSEDGTPVSDHNITVEVSILQGNGCDADPSSCTTLWQELHSPKTNNLGGFNIEIGSNDAINTTGGSLSKYSDIQWLDTQKGYYYMQVRVDFGEATYLNGMTDLGTTKFSAVPYALAATTAESAKTAESVEPKNGKIGNKLQELADVTITEPKANQILVFDGSTWKNTDPAAAQGLTNINISNPETGDILVYDATSGKWQNQTPTKPALSTLTDINLGTLNNSNILSYNSTSQKWENKILSLNFINGVSIPDDITKLKNGQVLTYNDGVWGAADAATGGSDITKLSQLSGDVSLTTPANGQTLQYKDGFWTNADPTANDIWKTAKNSTYTTYSKVGIGTAEPTAMLHLKDGGNHTLISPNGITIGGNTNRIKETGSIALTNGAAGDVGGSAVIAGSGSTSSDLAVNCIILGDKSKAESQSDIVIANNSEAKKEFCALFGNYLYSNYAQCALFGNTLKSQASYQYIFGRYNNLDADQMFIVANGTNDDDTKNIFTIDGTGNVYAAGTINGSSDARLKTNVNTLTGSLDNVLKLRGVTFNWKKSASNDRLQYGFIAQEVEKIFPDLVGTDSNGFKTINYSGVIPVLTEAIKTQQEEIEELKSENQQLKSTLEQLLKRVEALENK